MTCVRCGGAVHMDAFSCFHCGASIDHNPNVYRMDQLIQSTAKELKERRTRLFSRSLPVSRSGQWILWLSLILPAIAMPYVFRVISMKYREADSALLDVSLSLIVFLIFYSVKKAMNRNINNG